MQGSRHRAPIREQQEEIERWLERAAHLVERAGQVKSKEQARRLLEDEIEQARRIGLTVRLARAARWLSSGAAGPPRREDRTAAWSGDR